MKPTTTILLIDDLSFIRDCIQMILGKDRYTIFEAADATTALSHFENNTIDIVITDLVMPGSSGIDLIVELKKRNPDIKIIAMSGAHNKEDALELARISGAHEIICKPFRKEALIAAIEKLQVTLV